MDDASGMANPAAAKATPEDELTTGRRETQRARVHLSATLVATTREYAVTLRHISCTGAMVEGDDLPPNGRPGAMRRGDIDELGDAVRGRGNFCRGSLCAGLAHERIHRLTGSSPAQKST